MANCRIAILLSFAMLLLGQVFSQRPEEIPAKLQFVLFTKILSFDRNLEAKVTSQGEIKILIIFHGDDKNSLQSKNDFVAAINAAQVKEIMGHPITYEVINLRQNPDLNGLLSKHQISCVYLTYLENYDPTKIINLTRQNGIISLTGNPGFCEAGLSVGIESNESRARIVINLGASRKEACDFSSQLLKMARLVE